MDQERLRLYRVAFRQRISYSLHHPSRYSAALAFCLLSSCVYILNDILDVEYDRKHHKNKSRPIAMGEVSVFEGIVLLSMLGIFGFLLGLYVSVTVLAILVAYFIMNIFYDYALKRIVLLDVFCISAGFMLRILAGTIGVGIPPSKWLLLCGLMITLFLGFAKRRAEYIAGAEKNHEMRSVLKNYSPLLLDELITICATGAILSYSLYTMSQDTIRLHKTENLIYTVPFVIYAIFRYIYLLHHHNSGEDPSRDLLKDPHILATVSGWAILTIYLVKFN